MRNKIDLYMIFFWYNYIEMSTIDQSINRLDLIPLNEAMI